MKLYDGGRAPNPRRVRIFLAEKGITVPTEQVELGQLQQRSDAYTAINPMQRVPALVLDDGTVIAESIAICRYFEALQPDPPLFGRGALESALVEMWSRQGRTAPVPAGRHRVPASASGDEDHGRSAGRRPGARPTSRGSRSSCSSSTASSKPAPMWPAQPLRLPTSRRWSRSISCACQNSPCRTISSMCGAGMTRCRRGRARRLEVAGRTRCARLHMLGLNRQRRRGRCSNDQCLRRRFVARYSLPAGPTAPRRKAPWRSA